MRSDRIGSKGCGEHGRKSKQSEIDLTPLCVDLDHTLVNTDTMIELALSPSEKNDPSKHDDSFLAFA